MRPERAGRGPRPAHSRDEIAAAAVRIADADGLDAVSMRRVAAEIGSSTMALYNYVSHKDDLLDLMIDAVAAEYRLPNGPLGAWRPVLVALARQTRAIAHRHPWLPRAMAQRPGFTRMGPNTLRYIEFVLTVVEGVLDGTTAMELIGLLNGLVFSYVQSELAQTEAVRQAGDSAEQFQASLAAYLGSVVASGRYPRFTQVVTEGGTAPPAPDEIFDRIVNRLLNGYNPAPGT
ncbi:TetR/AcrR family transcriptional regulator [Planosporangium thailandense]|uniref:TetR/AcrR family transcriptional regulator n=2 Tax=Planosporangium thailandense TaxID=765197 RepID=A0ABX0Y2K3_9ACTN|nr:TetR/AcrR family transcriptional regulator C-terminal domain-containing protein [Planosporangium thailandense]NJC72585.1 TetR/AcrR family transcriptional regulator [Planosporangium thailandense]